jgi:7-carboxy-7-deazaguanine synthase
MSVGPAPAPVAEAARLRITEIFLSLQGEADSVGWPTTFVRLTGCPLRCRWCDTAYAFEGGTSIALEDIVARVDAFGVRHVCVTGGEPLAQRHARPLLAMLCDAGYEVSLETSGALLVDRIDPRVRRVVDVKAPGSGESHRNLLPQLATLGARDLVKFVLADRADYEWSRDLVRSGAIAGAATVLFSPVWGGLEPRALADWIVEDRLPVRFQLQLHKILWGDVPGR